MKKSRVVIGIYRCGCSYGPIKKSERLEYCATHGEDIQSEYDDISFFLKREEGGKDDTESTQE